MKVKDWFLEFGRGAALGTGILPGVSVGTVGLIVKVYDRLLEAISGLTKHFGKAFKTLLPIALGCIVSALLLLFGYSRLKNFIPFEIIALMAGLILGGAPIIVKQIDWKAISIADVIRMILGFVFAAGIGIVAVIASKNNWFDVGEAFLDPNNNIWVYFLTFFVGVITAVACLLPGISGSMVLFIFGLYNPVVGLYSGENSMLRNHDRIGTGLILTAILFVGVVVGLLAFAKIMRNLEERHHQGTFTLVLGFVAGSLISMFVNHEIWAYYESGAGWYHYLIG
ncbi:MAG: DUF368 domain-containing protein, partial [Bacilli bacterium]|nr:DUF368 domain-containing protein [Bacilli bacterium]